MRIAFEDILHPASVNLLRLQSRAKFTRVCSSFRNPRRQLLAVISVVLGLVWLSQAVAAVMLRESASREQLLNWIPLGLLTYSAWHLIKTITRKPVEPFEWTPAELELIQAAPFSRTQMISYRLASIFFSAVAKSFCFSVVMIPDLHFWPAGFLGMLLGLIFVDLIRVGFELFFHGLSKPWQTVCRVSGLTMLIGLFALAIAKTLLTTHSANEVASPAALLFFQQLFLEFLGFTSTGIGTIALAPFRPFAEVILADQISAATMANSFVSISIVGGMTSAVYFLDRWMLSRTLDKEKLALRNVQTRREQVCLRRWMGWQSLRTRLGQSKFLSVMCHQLDKTGTRFQFGSKRQAGRSREAGTGRRKRLSHGFGSLVWRQLLGAWHYRMTLAISLGVPTLLCCIPLLANHSPFVMLLNIVGGIVFYSFLLLPSALMLDFRRDINRIVVLKSLPIGPIAMTLGQLAAPVLICSTFQWIVLAIATLLGSVIAWQALIAAIILLPVNLLIFAIENYIYLLAPYRRNQEGLDVFLRTILTFTAKGILFAAALAVTLAWAFSAKALGTWLSDSPATSSLIFALGLWAMTCILAAGFVWGVVRLYDRFDPSQDAPAIS